LKANSVDALRRKGDTMIAAIYARKSTEQNGVGDEEKSVTRQSEHAKTYAAQKGWAVTDEYVYVDDGISGAEFANRPGFVRLMNALKPRAPFAALVLSESSQGFVFYSILMLLFAMWLFVLCPLRFNRRAEP
jgi:hypothetical protein